MDLIKIGVAIGHFYLFLLGYTDWCCNWSFLLIFSWLYRLDLIKIGVAIGHFYLVILIGSNKDWCCNWSFLLIFT